MNANDSKEPKPCGVGGWLLVLCIWITIVSPVFSFASLSELLSNYMWLGLPLIAFSIVTGILLWSGKHVGLKVATIYFWVSIGLSGLSLFMDGSAKTVSQAIVTTVLSGIWLLYLDTSERVMNTYFLRYQWTERAINPKTKTVLRTDFDDTLRKLAKLRDDKIITDEEFNVKKKEILDS